jgi:hypothetical protein
VEAVGALAAVPVEQVERAAQPEPQATQAARQGVRAATALLNPPAAKAVRLAIPLLNLPAPRAKIASIRQGRELGRGARPGALVRALKSNRTASPAKIGDGNRDADGQRGEVSLDRVWARAAPTPAHPITRSVFTNPNRKRHCYPICAFACQIAAVDQVPVYVFGRTVA